ncbi:MAG: S1 RNA-binding domain-containing protein [Erysipelotrichaceae bacterium]|nr:S1 RNA-binding domain-containing protein [Erysipelotrichaceae bacterium]
MEGEKAIKLPAVGTVAVGTVAKVYPTYAILIFDEGWTGLLHISELSNSYIRSFTSFVTIGTLYSVKVIRVDASTHKVHVSLKQVTQSERRNAFCHRVVPRSDISFDSLREHLPLWIEQENKETIND